MDCPSHGGLSVPSGTTHKSYLCTFMKTTVLQTSVWLSLVLLVGGVCSSSAGLRIWDGSSSGYWGNGQNWVFGGIGPVAGDDLVFAPGPSRVIMTNDLLA